MFLRPCYARTAAASPLSWFSRSRPAIMPLRAKITNPALAGQAKMSTRVEEMTDIKELPEDEPEDVVFNTLYGVRTIELNRPKKLNSLNGSMARKIIPRLKEWEKSDLVNCIMITGAGPKAFCAGGDVAALAQQNAAGPEGQIASTEYFALEYKLDHLIATYTKPYIAIMDGITMGGGVGLSVHAPFRIATERTMFAMPETTIGLFPDVGGSFFLSRLDGGLGAYLAMTSERLVGVQTYYAGIASHYMHSSTLAQLTTRLSELVLKDYLTYQERLKIINETLAEYATGLPHEPIQLSGDKRKAIDEVFALPTTVSDVLSRLTSIAGDSARPNEIQEWATKTQKTLQGRSPTSMAVTLRQLHLGRKWTIAQTFVREHVIAARFMRHQDFINGVTARLVSKPPTDPVWDPATPGSVPEKTVDEFFTAPSDLPELKLLQDDKNVDYSEYPHAWTGLPTEVEIKRYVQSGETKEVKQSPKKIAKHFFEEANGKPGVMEKVNEVLGRMTRVEDGVVRWIQ